MSANDSGNYGLSFTNLEAAPLGGDVIAERWERDGYVAVPPHFHEQLADETRTAQFSYAVPGNGSRGAIKTATESEGLQQVSDVLVACSTLARYGKASASETALARQAEDIHENLTFIGEPEFREAARGIGQAWKAWLDADPGRQLCVLTAVNSVYRYRGQMKSDRHVVDRVLQTFTEDELERYSGRIVNDVHNITVSADNCLAVLGDDWIVTGDSIRSEYNELMASPVFRNLAARGRVEAHVITASAEDIAHGLPLSTTDASKGSIPVRAYYKAHQAQTSPAIISGLHSSVNYRFSLVIDQMVTSSSRQRGVPALAHVEPVYRTGVRMIEITPDGLRRLSRAEISWHKATASGSLAVRAAGR